jgi:hypothetical protein
MSEFVTEVLTDIELVRNNDVPARVHPNGFLQLNLPNDRRLHIWPEEPLPQSNPLLPIHDHTFAFESTILTGKLSNITREVIPIPDGPSCLYEIYPFLAGRGHNPFIRADSQHYDTYITEEATYRPGDVYEFPPFVLHETVPEGCTATVIKHRNVDKERRARVVCPRDLSPDGSYRRDGTPQGQLWNIIGQLIARLS